MNRKVVSGTMLTLLSLLLTVAGPYTSALTAGQNPNDDFNDNSIDANKWLVYTSPTGSVNETNQELQMELTSSTGYMFEAGVTSNWTIGGDFDIQVDYRLAIWPENNGIALGLQAGMPTVRGFPDVVERVSAEPEWGVGEVYLAHFSDGIHGITPTNHTSGKLRLTRIGSTMTGYYFDGSGWIALHSASTSTGNGTVRLCIWGDPATPGVRVAFDNFVVNYGEISEYPTTEEVYSPEGIDPYFTMHVVYLLMIPSSPAHACASQMLRMMAQNLAGLGIEVHLNFVPMEEMGARVFSGRIYTEGGYDATFFAFLMGQPANLSETAQWMRETYHSSHMPSSGGTDYNLMMWNNTENDALLDAAVASTNTTEIEILLHEWQALFYQEQPAAIVYYRNSQYGLHSAYGQASLNMLHPVFGTGINTPLGQSNVTRAAEAARYVRQAISYTIHREWTVSNLPPEQQPAQPGITPITPAWPGFDPSLQPYALNLTEARRLLSLAGYGMTVTGSSPITLWVTDSLGRHVGVDPETGNVVNEIPWAFYSGSGTKPQVVYIPWPQGQYTIQATGTDTGGFTLEVTQVTEQTFTGVVAAGTTHVYTTTTSTAGAETVTPGPIIELGNAKDYINAVPDEAFVKNPDQLGGALNSKFDEVISKIEEAFFEDAVNKLANDIYPKVTGDRYDYYASGYVKAWIIDPAIQEVLQEYFCQIIDEIEATQNP